MLLCIGCIALAVLARYRTDTIGWAGWRDEATQAWHGWGINSEGSRLLVYHFWSRAGKFDDPTNMYGVVTDMAPHFFHHVMGDRPGPGTMEWKVIPYSPSLFFCFVAIPHAVLAIAFALPALVALVLALKRRARERVRERRVSQGHCEACGYDLRASMGRCPECGNAAPAMISTSDFVIDY